MMRLLQVKLEFGLQGFNVLGTDTIMAYFAYIYLPLDLSREVRFCLEGSTGLKDERVAMAFGKLADVRFSCHA